MEQIQLTLGKIINRKGIAEASNANRKTFVRKTEVEVGSELIEFDCHRLQLLTNSNLED